MSWRPAFPDGKRFAFTIIDDTDVATVENVQPLYDLLHRLGFRTTKTVWPLRWEEGWSAFAGSETLEDPHYLEFVRTLQSRGFEIASHGARMESSDRDRTLEGLSRMEQQLGAIPRVYANHSFNRENLYWGPERVDIPVLRVLYRWMMGSKGRGHFLGGVEGSAYWWGDLCRTHHEYVRNLTYTHVNVLDMNPTMPYRDPGRPLVNWWFSAVDADNVEVFVERFNSSAIDTLERSGGVCIVATHLGKQFVRDGAVDPRVQRILEDIASRDGWLVPVGELLDCLRAQRGGNAEIPRREWRAMQWRWALDFAWNAARSRIRRAGTR
ncbi:MAG TPA: hypothetical protein VGE27_12155 [Gemmatimonas sp.]|uniref:hypothetical protein n=1 Tax=Gemmatimonas sp. TaxID=1962908 RepID=UPI002ED984E5